MIIYKIQNKLNGKVYIGQTIHSLEYRKNQHLNCAKNHRDNCRLLNNALRKYKEVGFYWDIIDDSAKTQEELNFLENYYITSYDSMNRDKGYNLTTGGIKPVFSEETKRKIGESQKGELNHMYGIKGVENPSSKAVYNVTDNIYYDSATICAKETGLSHSKICATCRGDRATTGNKVFRYVVNGVVEEVIPKTKKKTKPVINRETGEVFSSAIEAELKYYGSKNGCISRACKEGVYRKGYWKFLE